MEQNPRKFAFHTVKMLEDVETLILSFVQKNWWESRITEFFNEKLSSENKAGHSRILDHTKNLLVIETSRFNKRLKEYQDHEMWIFLKQNDEITLNRYRI